MIEQLHKEYIEAGYKISTDTRNIIPGSIFFALKGENFDGNKYAAEAIKKGASIAVIDNVDFASANTILVNDTLETLQLLAREHRQKSDLKVIGITGTNGKTTTKELIHIVLSKKFKCHATQGNLNNHIGVPLTILSSPPDTELLVVEMGANHIGEIKFLCDIAKPDCGLITNIGKAHLEGFGSFEGVIKAKNELFEHLINNNKTIFFNESDKVLIRLLSDYKNVLSYGTENSGCFAGNTLFKKGIETNLHINNERYMLTTKLFGEYNITNILAATKIGIHFGISPIQIIEAINSYIPKNHRSQIIKTSKNTLILDSYNANPSSMQAAIKSFHEIKAENKLLILGSMKELGSASLNEHNELVKLASAIKNVKLFLVGKEFSKCELKSAAFFSDTIKLIDHLKEKEINKTLILIKGSRANKLEETTAYL